MKKAFPVLLLVFGLVLAGAGVYTVSEGKAARDQVRSTLAAERITIGDRVDPRTGEIDEVVPARWSGRPVNSAAAAEAQAEIIRRHALESTGGLTYTEMGRFIAKDSPKDPAGTSDPKLALVDSNGKPVPNQARNTAKDAAFLRNSLYSSVMAFRVSELVLGLGFLFLAFGVVFGGVGVVLLSLAVPAVARRFRVQPVVVTT